MFIDFLYDFDLTKDQSFVAEELDKFLYNQKDFLIVQGSAGTGKTFLISQFARYLKRKNKDFVFLAPTGRAADILSNKSGFQSYTIHSVIYDFSHERINFEEDIFQVFFNLKEDWKEDMIFIVDESSMISDSKGIDDGHLVFGSGKLLTDLISYVFNYGSNNKIIFLGDENQLPPVNSSFSPALNRVYLEKQFNLKGNKVFLEDVVRQEKESGILKNSNILKEKIKRKNYYFLDFVFENDFLREDNIIENYMENNGNLKDKIILCSTNKIALEYNKIIRKKLGYFRDIEIGDILLNTKNSKFFGKVFNGEFFEVVKIYDYISENVEIKNKFVIPIELYKLSLKKINSKEKTYDVWILGNALKAKELSVDNLTYYALYKYILGDDVKNINFDIIEKLKSNPYFNALHMKYGYAVTVHKAQGGEWDTVYVDCRYYNNYKTEEYFRWLYTSITRSKKKVYLKNIPAFRSGYWNKIKVLTDYKISKNIKIEYTLYFKDEGTKHIYEEFRNMISNEGFQIIGVKHFQYQEVYYLKKENDFLIVQLYYNKKYEATTLKIIESTNENVANEFLNLFNKGEIQIKEINNEIKSNNKCIKAYVDGSYDNKIKRYGSGIVIIDDNNIGEYYCYGENEELLKYRNISGEIIATLIALEYAKQNHVECMEIYYDYSGIENWALGYWKTNNYLTKRYKELFDKYINDYTLKVIFRKVKAHSGNNYNEIADKLAKKALFERKCNVEKFFVNV